MSAKTVRRPTLLAGLAALAVVVFAANDAAGAYDALAYLAVAGGGVLALATGLASRDEPIAVFAASVLLPAGGVAVLAAAALSAVDMPLVEGVLDPLVMVGLAAAGFGGVAAFTGGVGSGEVGGAFSVAVATSVLPFLAAIGSFFANVDPRGGPLDDLFSFAGAVVDVVVTPTGGVVDVVAFAVVVAVAARALAAGVAAAPLVELAAREHRDRVARAARTVEGVCLSVWRLLVVGWALVFVAFVTGIWDALVDPLPGVLVDLIVALAHSGAVRVLLIVVAAVSVAVVVGLYVARVVTGDLTDGLRRVAPTAGGGVLAVAVGVVFARHLVVAGVGALPEESQEAAADVVGTFGVSTLALVALVVPLVVLSALLLLFAALEHVRAVPRRAAPASVAAAGLVLAGAFAGIQNAPPEFVFGLVAAGMVAWDAGEYGVGVAAELGRRAPSERAELVHVLAAALVGVVAYYGAGLVYDVSTGIGTPDATTALAAMLGAGVGVAALVAVLAE